MVNTKSSLRLLIIEDDADDIELLLFFLQKHYLISATILNSLNSIKNATSENWDLVISDFYLVNFTALDFIPLFKSRNRSIPIILISGLLTDSEIEQLNQVGIDSYIPKRDLSRIILTIKDLVGSPVKIKYCV
jgi:CheY-like chemotaxis protein